jgi:putative iron-dependent peroxidase
VKAILADLPSHARYLTFALRPQSSAADVASVLASLNMQRESVFGMGISVVALLGAEVPGLRKFPAKQSAAQPGAGEASAAQAGAVCETPAAAMPSSAGDLWCWLRGNDRGTLMHQGRALIHHLQACFTVIDITDGFHYAGGLDLTGYEDGTENPEGDHAVEVAIVKGQGPGLNGSSFVAVQKWQHDFAAFDAMSQSQQDATIGRRRSDNEEIEDAPESAHVKRTAQEGFEPEAFLLRRSMPWVEDLQVGLMFVAFGASFEPFEALAENMLGLRDGVVDALFDFTQPVSGDYYWCPPLQNGGLDLQAVLNI